MSEITYKNLATDLQILVKRSHEHGIELLPYLRGRVLDAGCGRGYFVRELQKCGIDCYGIDIDPEKIYRAKKRVSRPEKVILGDLKELPECMTEYFDLIFSTMLWDDVLSASPSRNKILVHMVGYTNGDSSFVHKWLKNIKDSTEREKEGIMKGISRIIRKDGLYVVRDTRIFESIKPQDFGFVNLLSFEDKSNHYEQLWYLQRK